MADLTKQIENGLESISGQVNEIRESQDERINAQQERIQDLAEQNEELLEKLDKRGIRLDELIKNTNRVQNGGNESKSFRQLLGDAVEENRDKISALQRGEISSMSFEVRAASDMTEDSNYTGGVLQPDRLSGIHYDPERQNHVRQFLPTVPTTSNAIKYIQEAGWTEPTSYGQTEGTTKKQSDFSLEAKTAPVETRATFLRFSKQMLDDSPFLVGYMNQRAPQKLYNDEDDQILYGNGSTPNVKGISNFAQAWSNVLETWDNKFEILLNGIAQLNSKLNGEYRPNVIMINPIDWFNLALEKNSTSGNYILPESARLAGSAFTLAGVPVIANTAIASDDFFVGDFATGATFAQRESLNIRLFEQDVDNVQKNMITARIEERYALPVTNPNAFVHGDFTTALATSP